MLLPAQSTVVISTKFQRKWTPEVTHIATVYNPRTGFVVGDLAIVNVDKHLNCQVAVINSAPYDIQLERGDFIGAIEALQPQTAQVRSLNVLPVAQLMNPAPVQIITPG